MIVKAIITDFDGTLVDTFEANYEAYLLAFKRYFYEIGYGLTREQYQACFGLRFDAFMEYMQVDDIKLRDKIKKEKARVYPMCFKSLRPNKTLISFIRGAKASAVKTAIASTAQLNNLINVLNYLELADLFDYIIAGDAVKEGKPNPEIYLTAMSEMDVLPTETLIFEDSEVGLQAAEASGANYIKITEDFFY